jgi:prepilin-type N-terminal cleavage/methylation domain-containing protein
MRLPLFLGRRQGFTLIELLVVIAIIAILIALLVPAVQKVRDAAAVTQCINNLKQLGIGCHNYHDAQKHLPPAVLMQPGVSQTAGSGNFGPNWAVLILPYIEQGSLWTPAVQTSIDNYMTTPGENGWRVISTNALSIMNCPFDVGNHSAAYAGTIPGSWAHGNYACNAGGIHQPSPPAGTNGVGWLSSANGASPVYGSNASFGGPVPDGTHLGGLMCINWGCALANISDGSSCTVMLAEVRTGAILEAADPRGLWAVGMPGASVITGAATWDCTNPNDNSSNADDLDGCNANRWDLRMGCWPGCPFQQANTRSLHNDWGVNVCLADGSVRHVPGVLNQAIYWAMLGRDDAILYDQDELNP